MPSINVVTNELASSTGNIGATGTAFIPAVTDAGPITGPNYVACRSITDYTFNFGARSSTSATAFDWLDEFFHDGGQLAYVTRVTDNTATAATLTLNDAGTNASVVLTASPGVGGNGLYAVVTRGTNPTFSMGVTSGNKNCTGVTSFAYIGVGTPISGAGIAANTYITAINTAAGTAQINNNATATATETITPATFTLTIQDASGNVLETHGPYFTTAQLYADLTSTLVTFTQSSAGGNTVNVPAAVTATALTGGANANDLAVANSVSALANFPSSLGPGQVAIPGYANSTAWTGILAHCATKNRFGLLDLPDNSSSASVIQNFGVITANGTYGMAVEGSLTLPGLVPGATRTVAGSAAVAAVCAQVAAGSNQARPPCGPAYPITYPQSFTLFHGPGGTFLAADVAAMEAAGINCFAIRQGVPCLFGFVTPTPKSADITYWQASASRERMALDADQLAVLDQFLFDTLTGDNATLIAAQHALQVNALEHFNGGALFGATPGDAFQVNIAAPVNTATTEAAGQLNTNTQVHISPYVDVINASITTVPITVPVA